MDVIIHNEENLPDSIIEKAIFMMEEEEGRKVKEITVRSVGVDKYGITPIFEKIPFKRIRRITGYLVGDMNRFNDAKTAEVRDRVKHTT